MEQIVVKSEMQDNGEILLFYVDENGGNEEGVLTTVESIENQAVQLQQDDSFIIEDVGELSTDMNILQTTNLKEHWTEDEIKRLLTFYNDNKQTFISGSTKKTHLWTVACKTMLLGKTPSSCEQQLCNLKSKYAEIYGQIQKGLYVKWQYFELCHQIFHDETFVKNEEEEHILPVTNPVARIHISQQNHETFITRMPASQPSDGFIANIPNSQPVVSNNGVFVMKKVNSRPTVDDKVEMMLKLYLKYKKNFQQENWRRGLWDTISMEIGEEDGEYWQKRFLNYKQHYLRLLEKRRTQGPGSINWPYLALYDRIFEDDEDFRKKFINKEVGLNQPPPNIAESIIDWNTTEMTVLAKYCFDCYDEFEDRTIPNKFLWNEIGHLLDKTADDCKKKYEELKNLHLLKCIEESYDMNTRKPIEILYDNIISKETASQIAKGRKTEPEVWKTEELDELVQFFYDKVEMYKDPICHFVCWAVISKKLKRPLQSCRAQWDELVNLYKTILNDKKENPDMQIDWRYIEVFDRIFDYGMDENLLMGYDKFMMLKQSASSAKIGVKKVNINLDENPDEISSDDETYDERGYSKRTRKHAGDSKAFKILEYYQKNKEKFNMKKRNNKLKLWEVLAKQIGISAQKCAHRFRNLKQVYIAYVQREINKPDMPIMWPYYALCKKVFGYRAIKSKLKNGKLDSDDSEDWSAKEIKQLIIYFSNHFDEINENTESVDKWTELSADIGKSENSCKEKFLELRKSFRKLKTMRSRNPDVKISWKYFNMFERIYSEKEGQGMEVDGETYVEMYSDDNDNMDQEEDDYQCIIVLPEDQDISNIENGQIIIQDNTTLEGIQDNTTLEEIQDNTTLEDVQDNTLQEISNSKPLNKWTKRTKKRLLIQYILYVRSHKGHEIIPKQMWAEISSKLPNKTPMACRKMFAKLKTNHKQQNEHDINKKITPYYNLMEKIMRLKPKFAKSEQNKALTDEHTYKDVVLPDEKVDQALKYYLQHIEEFVSPKFEKKYLWTELANHVSEPITKVFNKINYLKQYYTIDTNEVAGQVTQFGDLLKEIFAKEIAIKLVIDNEPKPETESITEDTWTDEEKEQLLEWYLSNLDKFKNPKFVRSYLWMEASSILNKSAIVCSKMMSEIRTLYRNMVRERPEELIFWRFHDLCQKIYGTGKKGNTVA